MEVYLIEKRTKTSSKQLLSYVVRCIQADWRDVVCSSSFSSFQKTIQAFS